MQQVVSFDVVPIGKPRMTQRDKWKNRDCVVKYYAFKDAVNLIARSKKFTVPAVLQAIYYIPMPDSWSQKKRVAMEGKPHQQKPDTDNITKAFTDSLAKDDSYVWWHNCRKYWAKKGRIDVYLSDHLV